jgi:hypothetical protein
MPRRGKAPVRGWDRAFDDPIPLPNGSELVTLRDAGNFIAKLPKREHGALEWQAAIRALMIVPEHDGQTLLARIGMMRVNRGRRGPGSGRRRIGSCDERGFVTAQSRSQTTQRHPANASFRGASRFVVLNLTDCDPLEASVGPREQSLGS